MQDDISKSSFTDDMARVCAQATLPVTSQRELKANLLAIVAAFYDADLTRYNVEETRATAAREMQRLFELRLALRNQIPNWDKRGFMTHDVQKALRQVFLVTRYASDMLGEIVNNHARLPHGGTTRRGFTGADVNVLVNPAYHTGLDLAFMPGDVVLVRGRAHNSAAIARIGDVESQFSHVGIIHRRDNGAMVMVESLIESGAIINPLVKALDHSLGRAIVFRHRDPALAAQAALFIHDHVEKRSGLRQIWYDFSMRMEGYRRLYCSKLVRLAYLRASKGDVKLPAYTTRLVMKNRDFLRRVGVKAEETFAPGDMEVDPRFDIVAEWQDYRVTAALRNQDMILGKLFHIMETEGYVFKEDWTIRLIGLIGRFSSHLSEEAKDMLSSVMPKVPRNMKRKTIAVVAMLHQTAEPLLQKVTDIERDVIKKTGHAPHPRDVLGTLEAIHRAGNGRIGYLVRPMA